MASRVFTPDEVARHNKDGDCWIIVENVVYDVSSFLPLHPGGKTVVLSRSGKDVTKEFHMMHSGRVLEKYGPKLKIGVIAPEFQKKDDRAAARMKLPVAYAEPYWHEINTATPYYNDSHRRWQKKIRDFVDKEMRPYAREWDEAGTYPIELHKKAYEAGIYGAPWPVEYGGTPPEGQWDIFHDLIYQDELGRCGAGGLLASAFFACNIGLPPVLNFGSKYLKDMIAREVITGEAIIALAVTEPWAGSDVANIQCTARKDGDYYIVTGEKKFITGGMKAKYFTAAVRTGPSDQAGMGGVSVLLIPADLPGITRRRIPTQGWWASNTAYLIFEEVRVPVKNLIGEENKGFLYIMFNFNHERWAGAVMSTRGARGCLEEAVKYARMRQTFGKRLVDHQVIRHKIAEMARKIEATHAWVEQVAFQMHNGADPRKIAGPIALLKVQATLTMEFCAREAAQILGGNSYIRGGHGEMVERHYCSAYREVRVSAIGGGSEEILRDFAARQARL